MMKKAKRRFGMLVLLVVLVLVLPSVSALSVGSFPSSWKKTVEEGETASFTISFYNLGNRRVLITLKTETELQVEYPKGEKLVLEPTDITTNPENEGSWFVLPGGKEYVKKQSLKVKVRAPWNISSDTTYPVKVIAEIRPESSPVHTKIFQSVVEVREYLFKLHVKKGSGYNGIPNNKNEITIKNNDTSLELDDKLKLDNTSKDKEADGENITNKTSHNSSTDTESYNSKTSSNFNLLGNILKGISESGIWISLGIWIFTIFVILTISRRGRY
jgi:hypothetical protein